jgi:hypothetical protein
MLFFATLFLQNTQQSNKRNDVLVQQHSAIHISMQLHHLHMHAPYFVLQHTLQKFFLIELFRRLIVPRLLRVLDPIVQYDY